MSPKSIVWAGAIIGSTIGGLLPMMWGGDALSATSLFLSTAGGFLGIWIGFKLSH